MTHDPKDPPPDPADAEHEAAVQLLMKEDGLSRAIAEEIVSMDGDSDGEE